MEVVLQQARPEPLATLALVLLSVLCSSADGQSGRRATGPQQPATVVPDTSSSLPRPSPARKEIQLLIARQSTGKHLTSEGEVFSSFVNRLNQYENINAVSVGELQRSQTQKRAKSENEKIVVCLTFDIDRYAGGTIILNSQDLEIEYFVFEPRTGRRLTQGKVYFQGVGSGRLRTSNWPNGTPVKMTPEAAGIEAAESLHQWLVFDVAQKKAKSRN